MKMHHYIHHLLKNTSLVIFLKFSNYTEFTDRVFDSDPLVQNLLSGLNCSGSEERLADCDHDGVGTIFYGCLRAAVRCKSKGMEECWKGSQIPTGVGFDQP